MDSGFNLAAYDFVVLGIFAFFIARGIWLCFLRQVTGLVALYLGYLVSSQYHDRLFPFLRDISDNPKVVFFITYVVLFLVAFLAVMLIGRGLQKVIEITITKWFDRLLGGVMGFAKGFILVILVHMLVETAIAPENKMLQTCFTCDYVNGAADFCRGIIRDPDLRDVLKQKVPAIPLDTENISITPAIAPEGGEASANVDEQANQ